MQEDLADPDTRPIESTVAGDSNMDPEHMTTVVIHFVMF